MTWLEYHELTKHSAESLRRTKHYLDWANMPIRFGIMKEFRRGFAGHPPAPQIRLSKY